MKVIDDDGALLDATFTVELLGPWSTSASRARKRRFYAGRPRLGAISTTVKVKSENFVTKKKTARSSSGLSCHRKPRCVRPGRDPTRVVNVGLRLRAEQGYPLAIGVTGSVASAARSRASHRRSEPPTRLDASRAGQGRGRSPQPPAPFKAALTVLGHPAATVLPCRIRPCGTQHANRTATHPRDGSCAFLRHPRARPMRSIGPHCSPRGRSRALQAAAAILQAVGIDHTGWPTATPGV